MATLRPRPLGGSTATDGQRTIEQPAFGRRLRQTRRHLGLTQEQIADGDMSPSYISLVESGRRTPSLELAKTMADRLGVPLAELTAPEAPVAGSGRRLGLVGRLISATTARRAGDLETAGRLAAALVDELSQARHDDDLWWEAQWLHGEVLQDAGELDRYEATLRLLSSHPFTAGSTQLQAQVTGALAEAVRQRGQLADCIDLAERAIEAARELDDTADERIAPQVTALIALATCGEQRRAESVAAQLLRLAPRVASRPLRGLVYWAAAGPPLLVGATSEALGLMGQATADLVPTVDLGRWAALTGALAVVRLHHDDDPGEARQLLDQSRHIVELVGKPHHHAQLAAVASLAELRTETSATSPLARLPMPAEQLTPATRAALQLVAARVSASVGDPAAAQAAYRDAAGGFEQAGAYRPAARAWRELTEFMSSGVAPATPAEGWLAIALP